jgi:hypothetical protein
MGQSYDDPNSLESVIHLAAATSVVPSPADYRLAVISTLGLATTTRPSATANLALLPSECFLRGQPRKNREPDAEPPGLPAGAPGCSGECVLAPSSCFLSCCLYPRRSYSCFSPSRPAGAMRGICVISGQRRGCGSPRPTLRTRSPTSALTPCCRTCGRAPKSAVGSHGRAQLTASRAFFAATAVLCRGGRNRPAVLRRTAAKNSERGKESSLQA